MPFLNVVQYKPSSSSYLFWISFYSILIFSPAIVLIYFSRSKSIDLESCCNALVILLTTIVILSFSILLKKVIENVRFWLTDKQLLSKPLKVFIPQKTNTSTYFPYHPSTLILRDEKETYPQQEKGTFLILNSLPYINKELIDPYYRIILCKELLNNEKILWHYFIIVFFLISLITAIYSFAIVIGLEHFIPKEMPWLKILLFFTFLSVFFGYMLYKFIQNIPIEQCSTNDIMHSITNNMSNDSILNFKDKEDLDKEFSIYKNGEFFSQKEALDSIADIDDNIVDKLKNIFQITAPIFYLANITIGILYLTKNI